MARIRLCPLRPEDSSILFDWINHREQVLHNAPYRPIALHDHEAWFRAVQSRPDSVIFGIRRADDDALIGSCQLRDIHPVHRNAELQIRIGDPGQRGQGLGTEAVRALVRFAFDDLNLRRVSLKVLASNGRALRTYEKAGFLREGVMRAAAHIDGQYVDVVIMGVLRDETGLASF